MTRDWHAWYRAYDDPDSGLSRRLATVRGALQGVLDAASGPVRLVSVCAGDGRDTLPVLDASDVEVTGVLVELDPELSARARAVAPGGIEVRTADAGTTASYADACPADVFLACGVFGNVVDDDIARTVAALPSLLTSGAHVIWTRGSRVSEDPTAYDGDPAELVRGFFADAGFEAVTLIADDDAGFRVGVHRWPGPTGVPGPGERLFDFV
ncbi:class I SAM-dependent methyltransferase [Nocardioides mangrovi]|uniref:Class I SAM-dependent methyltransferase n=1 Tax=Nocardioides mangrovi TaxID=2874580 RepID=A0ABS7UIR9_9ACTN|nr:class I SAM-dependent methyltransferase [Nocardioides mangrovi]MBZ5740700.1 class I SAM-dependent methyltransferase [Nocardioides mangrovi]